MKNKNFSIYLFVIGSLALFFLLLTASFAIVLWSNLSSVPPPSPASRYSFKDYDPGDPYVSKNPGLADLLDGPIIGRQDPWLGPEDAPVTIVVFSDFACAYCREQADVAVRAMGEFPGRVRLVRKDYPETDDASFSFQAAVAGRCAQEQGKFWEFESYLSRSDAGGPAALDEAPSAIGLDRRAYAACRNDGSAWHLVLDNMEEANALDISGVPFVYVNGQEFLGGIEYDDLVKAIDEELGKGNN